MSTHGGYLWRYSADLSLREGEGVVKTPTIWVQPPGTPSVGEAFVRLYEATGERQFLAAARAAAEALRQGQMRSGGWQAMVEFDPARRQKWSYRVDPPRKKAKDQSSLDDDKTQSALRFVMRLDRALQFEDPTVHEMAHFALEALVARGQFPNGAFPQVWTDQPYDPSDHPSRPAAFPASWSRTYPGHGEYWRRYTLNDNLAPDVVRTLLLAEAVYDEPRYGAAARRAADFLLLAQMPDPQPAWAQQYDYDMRPIWARKFEPPAITAGESQGIIETLMVVYTHCGESKYLEPVPRALDYLKRSELEDGALARFYELKSNKPLYFTADYRLTYDGSDAPSHYSFKVGSRVDRLRRDYDRLVKWSPQQLALRRTEAKSLGDRGVPRDAGGASVDQALVRRVVNDLDRRGAWVTDGGLRYHQRPGPTIDMRTTVANLNLLAAYLANQTARP